MSLVETECLPEIVENEISAGEAEAAVTEAVIAAVEIGIVDPVVVAIEIVTAIEEIGIVDRAAAVAQAAVIAENTEAKAVAVATVTVGIPLLLEEVLHAAGLPALVEATEADAAPEVDGARAPTEVDTEMIVTVGPRQTVKLAVDVMTDHGEIAARLLVEAVKIAAIGVTVPIVTM